MAEVGLGHVGLVMGLEVSRLARSSLDWHHLLEICTMTGTLILDEDGLYDPATFNDRLLLGLKGTMSEAELHVLQARLKGGMLHKASRAALKVPLPVGLVYAEDQTVILDPDAQIQQAVRLLFATFKRTGSACATVKYFRTKALLFPRRVHSGPHTGELHWMPVQHSTVLKVLRNPRYAGAFCFGRTRSSKHPDGSLHVQALPQEQWLFLMREVHAGYLSWQDYEANLAQLRANRQAHGEDRRHGPPREGPALREPARHLRTLWQSDDGALPRCQERQAPLPGIPVSKGAHRRGARTSAASVCLEQVWIRPSLICCSRG